MTYRCLDSNKFFSAKLRTDTHGFIDNTAAKVTVGKTDDHSIFHGAFGKTSRKLLPRYVIEFAGRHNRHPLGTKEQIRQIANDLYGRRLRYKNLVA